MAKNLFADGDFTVVDNVLEARLVTLIPASVATALPYLSLILKSTTLTVSTFCKNAFATDFAVVGCH